MSTLIRLAVPADVPGIFHVRTEVRENVLTQEQLAEMGITPAAIAELLAQPEPCAWVAEQAGRIVGFSMIDAEEGSLFAAFVLPECEGQGLGRQLVVPAEAALFAQHERIWLETAVGSRAEGFYRHLGWGEPEIAEPGDVRLYKRRLVTNA